MKFTYEKAMDFIHNTARFGSKLGLDNIRELLKRLGNPQEGLKFIHVAGTNGKGTVTRTVSQILSLQGYTTGMYTSPFLYKFEERICVDGVQISENALTDCCKRVKNICEAMTGEGMAHPTEFEVITAIALLYFKESRCEFAVLEVGMGGRLDATNVIESPIAAVISLIGYDHMEYLGDTLCEIAHEKCGIIKGNTPVAVYCEQPGEALDIIKERCREKSAPLFISQKPDIKKSGLEGSVFSAEGFEDLETTLIGEHMAKNLSLALCCVKLLRDAGAVITDESIRRGVWQVRWPGRFEIVGTKPLFIIDGAHNEAGVNALKETLSRHLKEKSLIFIMGMLKDKEYDKCLEMIAPVSDMFIAVTVNSGRALQAKELGECAKKYTENVLAANSVREAVRAALSQHGDIAVIAFGSLYLLGDVREALEMEAGN